MRRKFKAIDPKEFTDVEFDNRTMKGEMRKYYSEINKQLKEAGWTAQNMVSWFNERDVPLTVPLFRVYLWDLDREHGYKRSTDEFLDQKPKGEGQIKQKQEANLIPTPSVMLIPPRKDKKEEGSLKVDDKPKTFVHQPSPNKDELL